MSVSLTWNGDNALAGGTKGKGVLTPKGESVIQRLNSLRIALDISHLNESSAIKAVELAKYPIATHSNCRAICDNARNLTDELLLKIKAKSGLVGICFYPDFLGDKDVFSAVKKNIEHLTSLGMENNISVGSDFDGGEMDENLTSPNDIPKLYNYLLANGFKKRLLEGIFYRNAIAFFDRMCHNKRY
jgi:membrane dipeptidase